ncbi:hypothetical protein GCK32_018829 [Trichostrongylus colubriformis]|uniref:Uncharacterized protein n=1 Tax=Trichostrongylus colubriformis TaxID=6319 RepID=A0AAN8FAS0_TRICO
MIKQAQVLLSHIVLGKDVASSLSLPRVFATSEGASFEVGLPMELLTELRDEFSLNPILTYDSVVHCMQLHVNNTAECFCDFRDGFDVCGRGF